MTDHQFDNSLLWQGLALQSLYTTELAALAAHQWLGMGNSKAADAAAVHAMRRAFDTFPFAGRVVIGEGERDKAPMLYAGETFGRSDHPLAFDIAVDPLEGTALATENRNNAITILAMAPKDHLLSAPDVYMQKFVTSTSSCPSGFSFDAPVCENIQHLARQIGKPLDKMCVTCLDRERNANDINALRALGVRVSTFQDGDINACTQVALKQGVDAYFGSGGAPEGVITACILQCLGGTFMGRLAPRNLQEKQRLIHSNITTFDKVYYKDDLALPDQPLLVVATNVTPSSYSSPLNLPGVVVNDDADSVSFHSAVFQYYPDKPSIWYTVSRHCGYRYLLDSLHY